MEAVAQTHMSTVVDGLLTTLNDLAPEIARYSKQLDSERRLPAPLFEAMADAGLFRIWLPKTLDGAQLSIRDFLPVIEEASRLDGSIGWNMTVGVASSLLAGYMPDTAAADIFSAPRAYVGGQFNPTGTAIPVAGGYRVTGRWAYGSGVHNASGVFGNFVIQQDGTASDGPPRIRAGVFEPSQVEIIDNWHVSGLRGTGSCDFAVKDVFVPTERTVDAFAPIPSGMGARKSMALITLLPVTIAAVALGIARAAIDALLAIADKRTPTGTTVLLRDRETVQADVARAEALLRSSRAFLVERLDEYIDQLWEPAETTRDVPIRNRALYRLACTQVGENAVRVVDSMAGLGGRARTSKALRWNAACATSMRWRNTLPSPPETMSSRGGCSLAYHRAHRGFEPGRMYRRCRVG